MTEVTYMTALEWRQGQAPCPKSAARTPRKSESKGTVPREPLGPSAHRCGLGQAHLRTSSPPALACPLQTRPQGMTCVWEGTRGTLLGSGTTA